MISLYPLYRLPYRRELATIQMAIDSELPAIAAVSQSALLRFYGWSEEAVTFGFSQPFEKVREYVDRVMHLNGVGSLVRRPSGGGIVDHRNDLTYAFVLPHTASHGPHSPIRFYCMLHQALANALNQLDCPSSLVSCPAPTPKPAETNGAVASCFFDAPVPSDVIHSATGRKIAGAALRRTPQGILAQGSLDRSQLPPQCSADILEPIFATELETIFHLSFRKGHMPWPEALPSTASAERFSGTRWNQRR
jgi:lipoate-protein ligase A